MKLMLTQPPTELELELGLSLAIFLMTSHLDSHTTTDIKSKMIPGVLTGNGILHDIYNIYCITNAHTNRKNVIFMQRRL